MYDDVRLGRLLGVKAVRVCRRTLIQIQIQIQTHLFREHRVHTIDVLINYEIRAVLRQEAYKILKSFLKHA